MNFAFEKELYTKKALLCTAYKFTDRFYVHISSDSDNYYVDLTAKADDCTLKYEEFKNEMLSQTVRQLISDDTKELRTLIMARALSSSVIDNSSNNAVADNDMTDNADIMKDWFEQNG